MQKIKIFTVALIALAFAACESKPKVIEGEPVGGEAAPPLFQDLPQAQSGGAQPQDVSTVARKVVVKEVLDTDKYTYLRVKENAEEFWVAVSKREVETGGTYYFRGGLLKKNFQSREFERVFETLYLVSEFWPEGSSSAAADHAHANSQGASSVEPPKNVNLAPGAIKIADLVANLKNYEGKTVKVTGKVMKINPMIMGRNWIHLQDGSGKNLDLTITTAEQLQVGSTVTLEGTIALNKDFGAGYKYDYIMEGAVVK